jgi:hypothetical protein
MLTADNSQIITIATPPEPVGYWKIGDGYSYMSFAMHKRFTPEQIKNTEELLGWKWIDGKAQEK